MNGRPTLRLKRPAVDESAVDREIAALMQKAADDEEIQALSVALLAIDDDTESRTGRRGGPALAQTRPRG
jgi:hypothetical protein